MRVPLVVVCSSLKSAGLFAVLKRRTEHLKSDTLCQLSIAYCQLTGFTRITSSRSTTTAPAGSPLRFLTNFLCVTITGHNDSFLRFELKAASAAAYSMTSFGKFFPD